MKNNEINVFTEKGDSPKFKLDSLKLVFESFCTKV